MAEPLKNTPQSLNTANHPGSLFPGEIPYESIKVVISETAAGRPFSFKSTENSIHSLGCFHEAFRPHEDDGVFRIPAYGVMSEEQLIEEAKKLQEQMNQGGFGLGWEVLIPFLFSIVTRLLTGQ